MGVSGALGIVGLIRGLVRTLFSIEIKRDKALYVETEVALLLLRASLGVPFLFRV